jgi:hypothetical protein
VKILAAPDRSVRVSDTLVLMKILYKLFIIAAGLILLMAGSVSYVIFTWSSEKELAKNFLVYREWKEIIPLKPLKTEKCKQYVIIKTAQDEVADVVSISEWDKIRLINGEVVKPELEILDNQGKVFPLKATLLLREIIGYSPRDQIGFPERRVYKKVRIKSDKPFRCSISWYCTRCK